VAAATKPNNITELEVIAHEDWAKIPETCCQKLVSDLQKVNTAKLCSTKY